MLDSQCKAPILQLVLGLLYATATATSGCIADEQVLDPKSEAVAAPVECRALVDDGVVEAFRTGEPCATPTPAHPMCYGSENCSSFSADCKDNEVLTITDVTVLDCPSFPEMNPVPRDGGPIADCEVALSEGLSGQICEGSFTCGRVADTCCIELATCGVSLTADETVGPSQRLARMRVCTRDCENIPVDDSAVATDCASAYIEDAPYELPYGIAFGRACTGDFVCMDGFDIRGHGIPQPLVRRGDDIAFCQNGIVLGQPGPFGLNVPMLWATP